MKLVRFPVKTSSPESKVNWKLMFTQNENKQSVEDSKGLTKHLPPTLNHIAHGTQNSRWSGEQSES